MTNGDVTTSTPPEKRCISERFFVLSMIFAVLFAVAAVFFWFDQVSWDARSIMRRQIDVMREQRDQVLDQRRMVEIELDAYKAYVFELTGEKGLPPEEEEEGMEEE